MRTYEPQLFPIILKGVIRPSDLRKREKTEDMQNDAIGKVQEACRSFEFSQNAETRAHLLALMHIVYDCRAVPSDITTHLQKAHSHPASAAVLEAQGMPRNTDLNQFLDRCNHCRILGVDVDILTSVIMTDTVVRINKIAEDFVGSYI